MSQVILTIGGESFALKCTLDAFRTIPANLGGFVGAFNALASADVNTCAFIIAAATGKALDFKEHERVASKMFEEGLDRPLFDKLTEYVKLLQNGGKVKTEAAQGAPAGE